MYILAYSAHHCFALCFDTTQDVRKGNNSILSVPVVRHFLAMNVSAKRLHTQMVNKASCLAAINPVYTVCVL